MIQVVLEMDEQTGSVNIRGVAPPSVVLHIITVAYHEMLSMKIRSDLKNERRVIEINPGDGGRLS